MPYLIDLLLFLAPFAAYALWRRFNPGREPPSRVVWLALAGVGLGLIGAIWYGLSVSMRPGTVYVPARLVNGEIVQGGAEPQQEP